MFKKIKYQGSVRLVKELYSAPGGTLHYQFSPNTGYRTFKDNQIETLSLSVREYVWMLARDFKMKVEEIRGHLVSAS